MKARLTAMLPVPAFLVLPAPSLAQTTTHQAPTGSVAPSLATTMHLTGGVLTLVQ
jgi:hypothetical protein